MTNPRQKIDPTRALFKADKPEQVQALLSEGADVLFANEKGTTALINAVRKGRHVIIPALLSAGARVNVVDNNGIPMCIHAARSGNVTVLELLANAGMDLAARDRQGATALMLATGPSMIAKLLAVGQDVHARDHAGLTALHHIAKESRFILSGAFQELLQAGADINARTHDGRTALMLCTHPQTLRGVLVAGADASLTDNEGRNILHHLAVFPYKVEKATVEGLLAAGADPFQEDANRHTPMELFSDPHGQGARVVGDFALFAQAVAHAQADHLATTTAQAALSRPKTRI